MPPENQFQNQEQAPPKRKNTTIWVIFLVVVLAVGGMLIYFLNEEKEVVEEEPQVESEEPALETSDWQTYRNEEYGFEFRYPARFNLNIVAEDFIYPDYVHECFNAELIPENESNGQFQFRINCSGVGLDPLTTEQREDLIDGREAQRIFPGGYLDWEYPLTGPKKILIRHSRSGYNLVFWGHEINNEEDEELFNQIISTFKFLD